MSAQDYSNHRLHRLHRLLFSGLLRRSDFNPTVQSGFKVSLADPACLFSQEISKLRQETSEFGQVICSRQSSPFQTSEVLKTSEVSEQEAAR